MLGCFVYIVKRVGLQYDWNKTIQPCEIHSIIDAANNAADNQPAYRSIYLKFVAIGRFYIIPLD